MPARAPPWFLGLLDAGRVAATEEVSVDHDELTEARWFTAAEVRALGDGRRDSIEAFLVGTWLAKH